MSTLRISFLLVFIVTCCFLVFTGCSSDDDDDKVKLTQEQADQAIADNAAAIQAITLLVTNQAPAAATNFDLDQLLVDEDLFYLMFFKRAIPGVEKFGNANNPDDDDEFSYDGNGCWKLQYDSTDAVEGYSISILGQVCFDAYNLLGQPTEATNQMDYSVDFDFAGANVFEGGSFSFDLGLNRALNVFGIADYNSGTGNLILNGSSDENFDITAVSQSGSQSLAIDYSYTIKSVTFQPASDFPVSGIIEFSIAFTATPPVQDYPNYSVTGTITFDGTSIVVVSFAGFNYSMNIVSGEIY